MTTRIKVNGPFTPERDTDHGTSIERGFTHADGDSFIFVWSPGKQFGFIDTHQEPYCQIEFGALADGRFAIVTFCEGDLTREVCPTEALLDRAVTIAKAFYDGINEPTDGRGER